VSEENFRRINEATVIEYLFITAFGSSAARIIFETLYFHKSRFLQFDNNVNYL